jgi:hypothetical protein
MTPFQAALPTTGEEFTISDSIAQQEEIASWSINPAWTGDYPSEDWVFEIFYEVKNAGGAQINATVEVKIGGQTYTGTTGPGNSFLASGSGTLSITIPVDSGAIPSSTDIKVKLLALNIPLIILMLFQPCRLKILLQYYSPREEQAFSNVEILIRMDY